MDNFLGDETLRALYIEVGQYTNTHILELLTHRVCEPLKINKIKAHIGSFQLVEKKVFYICLFFWPRAKIWPRPRYIGNWNYLEMYIIWCKSLIICIEKYPATGFQVWNCCKQKNIYLLENGSKYIIRTKFFWKYQLYLFIYVKVISLKFGMRYSVTALICFVVHFLLWVFFFFHSLMCFWQINSSFTLSVLTFEIPAHDDLGEVVGG